MPTQKFHKERNLGSTVTSRKVNETNASYGFHRIPQQHNLNVGLSSEGHHNTLLWPGTQMQKATTLVSKGEEHFPPSEICELGGLSALAH